MRNSSVVLALALLSAVTLPAMAKADTIKSFSFNGTLQTGSISGTVTVDTTTGQVTNENLTAIVGKNTYLFNDAPSWQGPDPNSPYDYTSIISGTQNATFQLAFDAKWLVDYAGGGVYISSNKCNLAASALGKDLVTAGKLTPLTVAPTPEPTSLLLLGTGILGLAGAVRRRSRSAA